MPDETTLVPLNTVDAVVTDDKKDQQQRGHCFHLANMATIQHSVADSNESVTISPKRPQKTQPKTKHPNPSVIHVARCTKLRTVGANAANDPRRKKREFTIPTNKISEQPVPTLSSQPKN